MTNAIALTLAALVALATASPQPPPPQGTPLPVVAIHAPKADLMLEVARTEAQREFGLMNHTSLAPHSGMIFVFEHDGPEYFWMKETLIPLDMIFVGADGTVRTVYANVPVLPAGIADDRIPLESGKAQYVIELAGGEAGRDGIVAGAKLDVNGVPPSLPR